MIDDILTASGIPYRYGRYLNPPAGTYAIVFDDQEVSGPDPVPGAPTIVQHDIMIELYEPKPDPAAESAMESAIDAYGLQWSKQSRYWLKDTQRYQVIYEFAYNEKRRV